MNAPHKPDESPPLPVAGEESLPIGPGLRWALPPELRLDEQPLDLVLPGDPLASITTAGNLYLKARREGGGGEEAPAPEPPPAPLLVELAVEAWRLARRVAAAKPELGEKTERALEASANRLRTALERARTEWRDQTGDAYSDGMRSMRVLTFEPTEGIAAGERRILETVRPAVYINERLAAVGEVIVGIAIEARGEEQEQHDATDD